MLLQGLVEISNVSCGDNGVNVDIWSADSGGGGTGPSGLHLHHPGGLPRDVHLFHLSDILQASQGSVYEMVEGKGQKIDPTQEILWRRAIL